MNISIIGAGAWGTAVALSSFRAGHAVTLITKSDADADEINTNHENLTFFPGIKIPEELGATHRYDSISRCDILFLICPSAAIDDVCSHIKAEKISISAPVISFCKGLPGSTWELPSMYIRRHFPKNIFGVLSGPSYAREVALDFQTQLVLASENNCCKDLGITFNNMAILYDTDIIGVELGGCLKNIYAIGAGICDGLKLGDNAKCAYIISCLREMVHIGTNLGAQKQTFFGPSGLGDLLLTCSGSWSRNRTFGETITQNRNPQEIISESIAAVEGYRSTKIFYNIFKEKAIITPIVNTLYRILYDPITSLEEMKRILFLSVF
ncbi:MAG: NAD(P)H-dependent glycerol-3-phosphate dehydrogenase [Puniceicoccales bacterium]|jgi:glycerol-3-phosphate dehydrogenase (NAD(P)+)|nr:NAD(P)H-dependent glycerol-3-phosphate dehydrogenase [Puniceicoccales bacterium]